MSTYRAAQHKGDPVMPQRRPNRVTTTRPDPSLRPADVIGGETGLLWTTALERAGGQKARIAILAKNDVRIINLD